MVVISVEGFDCVCRVVVLGFGVDRDGERYQRAL